ncbi:MAG TPA: hypothetical protein VF171_07330 [Trueperaceae bacterium]
MYKTATDALSVRVVTQDFVVTGDMHLPPHVGSVDLLNKASRPFLPVTGAKVYASECPGPLDEQQPRFASDFLAIPKERILWMAGGRHNDKQIMTGAQSRSVYLLYPDFFLRGELKTPPNARLSDYLTGAKPFLVLFGAELGTPAAGKPLADASTHERFVFAVVNTRKLGGIFDIGQDPGESLEQF